MHLEVSQITLSLKHPAYHVVGFVSSSSKSPVEPRSTGLPTLKRSRMFCSSRTMVSVSLDVRSQRIKMNLKQVLPIPGVPAGSMQQTTALTAGVIKILKPAVWHAKVGPKVIGTSN